LQVGCKSVASRLQVCNFAVIVLFPLAIVTISFGVIERTTHVFTANILFFPHIQNARIIVPFFTTIANKLHPFFSFVKIPTTHATGQSINPIAWKIKTSILLIAFLPLKLFTVLFLELFRKIFERLESQMVASLTEFPFFLKHKTQVINDPHLDRTAKAKCRLKIHPV
jgi:hypothetical protein